MFNKKKTKYGEIDQLLPNHLIRPPSKITSDGLRLDKRPRTENGGGGLHSTEGRRPLIPVSMNPPPPQASYANQHRINKLTSLQDRVGNVKMNLVPTPPVQQQPYPGYGENGFNTMQQQQQAHPGYGNGFNMLQQQPQPYPGYREQREQPLGRPSPQYHYNRSQQQPPLYRAATSSVHPNHHHHPHQGRGFNNCYFDQQDSEQQQNIVGSNLGFCPPTSLAAPSQTLPLFPLPVEEANINRGKTTITVKLISSRKVKVDIHNYTETVGSLKQKIHEMDRRTPIERMRLFLSDREMEEDSRALRDYCINDSSEITVTLEDLVGNPSKLVVNISAKTCPSLRGRLPPHFSLEMEDTVTVSQLMQHLLTSQILPKDEYLFIHDHQVMENGRSLRWHNVQDGNVICVFRGQVDSQRKTKSGIL